MPIAQTDHLFFLIKSLNKSEKRNFKLFANRLASNEDVKFIQLFDALDKMEIYDEAILFKKIKKLSKTQLVNIKRHLYTQLLKSLRMIYSQKNKEIEIREQLDYAQILYDRGLVIQSLKLLERIKPYTKELHQNILYMEVLEFEKMIENRHITRSRKVKNKMETLIKDSSDITAATSRMCNLSNLMLKIQGLYINIGFVRDEKDVTLVKEYFTTSLALVNTEGMGIVEKIYFQLAYLWYHYILMEFESCAEYAISCVQLLDTTPSLISKDPDLYMRMLHYALTTLYYTQDKDQFQVYYKKLEAFHKKKINNLNTTSRILYFTYGLNAQINSFLVESEYHKAMSLMPKIESEIEAYSALVDPHRIIIYYYKLAWILFFNKKPERALDFLNKIVVEKHSYLRDDLFLYAKLLQILVHFELKHYELVEYQVDALLRFLKNSNTGGQVLDIIITYVKDKIKHRHQHLASQHYAMCQKITRLQQDKFEKRAFIYFDFVYWAQFVHQP